jgi:hypothetical protein
MTKLEVGWITILAITNLYGVAIPTTKSTVFVTIAIIIGEVLTFRVSRLLSISKVEAYSS